MMNGKKNSNMDTVLFNGRQYPLRHGIFVKGYGYRTIGAQSLEEVLFDSEGNYVSDEARRVDEDIFFFIDDKFVKCLDDRALAERVVAATR